MDKLSEIDIKEINKLKKLYGELSSDDKQLINMHKTVNDLENLGIKYFYIPKNHDFAVIRNWISLYGTFDPEYVTSGAIKLKWCANILLANTPCLIISDSLMLMVNNIYKKTSISDRYVGGYINYPVWISLANTPYISDSTEFFLSSDYYPINIYTDHKYIRDKSTGIRYIVYPLFNEYAIINEKVKLYSWNFIDNCIMR